MLCVLLNLSTCYDMYIEGAPQTSTSLTATGAPSPYMQSMTRMPVMPGQTGAPPVSRLYCNIIL